MIWIDRLRNLLSLPVDDPQLLRSQYQAFSRQVPLLYGILVVNTVALMATHASSAPIWLSIVIPGLFCVGCITRTIVWSRTSAGGLLRAEDLAYRLHSTVWLALLFGVGFTLWGMNLFPYGDAYARCHVAYYMSITVISCIFCLMHLRSAALVVTVVAALPAVFFFLMTGQIVLIAIAVNMVLVVSGMTFILLRNYADFAALVISQRELLERQAETERLSDENLQLANLDILTELPNRRRFLQLLDLTLARARSDGTRLAVALVDLDGFKRVNDLHGHAAGDRLLHEFGLRLGEVATASIAVARLGGDVFGAILTGNPTDAEILSFGHDLCARLRGQYLLPAIAADMTASVGLAAFPDCGETTAQLFERADYALSHAKRCCIGELVIFSEEHETLIRDAGQMEEVLRHADLDAELWLAFQPIVNAGNSEIIGFEALARWTSPLLGAVGPDRFIPVAEHCRLIGRLTETLLTKALAAASLWPAPLRISFNLSALDITSPATVVAIRRIIACSGMPSDRIDLEITETAVMQDFSQATEAIASLRRQGARISLDDFGTGYSSLSHVHRLKPDKIKIDRSFVAEVQNSQAARDIVRTIVDLCRTLGSECIVEGVETAPQMRVLTELGCRLMQGYLFSRPVREADLGPLLVGAHASWVVLEQTG